MKKFARIVLILAAVHTALGCWPLIAEAARVFTVTQITSPAQFSMGASQPVAFTIRNSSTAGETMTRVQFNVSGTYTLFPPQTITMTGWTCTLSNTSGSNYRRITCSASTISDRIPVGGTKDFSFSILNSAQSTDRDDRLSSVTGTFWTGSRTRTTTLNNQGLWTWKALLMTLTPSSTSVGNGCTFILTMTVTNRSSTNLTNITSIVKPPTPTYTGGASVATTSNPANLSLNAGVSSFMTWTYTLTGPVGGTVRFAACASTGGSCTTTSGTTRTSPSITSSTVAIGSGISCGLVSSITATPNCLYSGDNATFTMTVNNTTGSAVANVAPSALTSVVTGSAAIGAFTSTSPIPIASIPNNGSGTFTWTAAVTGNPNDTYAVTGFATANGPLQTATATSNVQDVDGYNVTVGTTTADSTDAELIWTITSYACSNVNQVSISVPGGWAFGGDAYALVTNTTGSIVDTWTVAGTTFTSPNATDRIPAIGSTGDFSLLFTATPTAPGTYTFTVSITDDAPTPVTRNKTTTVTVNPFDGNPGGANATGTMIWHEDIR